MQISELQLNLPILINVSGLYIWRRIIKYLSYNEYIFPIEIKQLLNEWDLVLKKFEKVLNSEDIPYIYGERANIGFLAAAATKLGYIVLEEYAIERRKKKDWKHGRADLWICSSDGSFNASIEANVAQSSWSSNSVPDIIKGAFKEVIEEAKEVVLYENPMYSIALVFLRPYNADPDQYDPDNYWNKFSDPTKYGADFCAMHFCKYELWSKFKYHEGKPGIGIVGKYIN